MRIPRIDHEPRDLEAVGQTEVTPGRSAIGRFVDPVADREVGTLQAFPASDIDRARIRWGDRNRPDGAGRLIVEDRRPGAPVVPAPPHAAVVHADVEHGRPTGTPTAATVRPPRNGPVWP